MNKGTAGNHSPGLIILDIILDYLLLFFASLSHVYFIILLLNFISFTWIIKNINFLMHNAHIRFYGRFIGSTLQAHTEVLDVYINT